MKVSMDSPKLLPISLGLGAVAFLMAAFIAPNEGFRLISVLAVGGSLLGLGVIYVRRDR